MKTLVALGVVLAAAPASGLAATVPLEQGARAEGARVAASPGGAAAAVYPLRAGLGLQLGGAGEALRPPVPSGAVVDGLVLTAPGRPLLVTRVSGRCGAVSALAGGDGGWSTPVSLGAGRAAAVSADAGGVPAVAVIGCGGAVSLWRPDAGGTWSREDTGLRAAAGAGPSVAAGGGIVVVGVEGRPAGIALRGADGAWSRLPLPGGRLRRGESASVLQVAVDGTGRPVALIVRARERPPDEPDHPLAPPRRIAARLTGGAWAPIAGRRPVALVPAGDGFALRRASGDILVETQAATYTTAPAARAFAAASDGTLAWMPSSGPARLVTGPAPTLELAAPTRARFGELVPVRARLTLAGAPVSAAVVAIDGRPVVTDGTGAATASVLAVRTGAIEAATLPSATVNPSAGTLSLRVVPRSVRIRARARVLREGPRIVLVRGSVAGGTALGGSLGRVWLLDLVPGPQGPLPGQPLASAPVRAGRSTRFRLQGRLPGSGLAAVFYEGRVVRLRLPPP
ncbi:MAG TPA: hypothetical protein VKD47_01565 [Miltoncostaeaceae bacterium]|nr:hypothetical protein [Miltoncostaeaceae bacterium]